MTRRPDRWISPDSDAPDGVRDLLSSARSPSPAQRARIWSAITASTSATPDAPHAPPPTPHSPAAPSTPAAPSSPLSPASLAAPASLGAKKLGVLLLMGLTWHRTIDTGLTDHITAAPVPVLTQPPPPPTDHHARRAHHASRVDRVAPAPVAQPAEPVAQPAARVARAPIARRVVIEPPPAPIAAPAVSARQLAEENDLLAPARDALRASPPSAQRALELSCTHAQRFPHGALTDERERIAIEALIALRRDDEALPRCDALLRDHPESTAARGVREARAAIVARRAIP